MRMRSVAAVAAAMLMAGCGSQAPSRDPPGATATPDPVEAQIDNLSAPLKNVAFFRAIRDAGFTCQRIVKTEARPRTEGRATWVAACDDGAQYGIVLRPGGTFLVTGANQQR